MRKAYFAAAIAAVLLLLVAQSLLVARGSLLLGDFRAFYCAGAALAHGSDPYAEGSLYACERSAMPLGLYRAMPGVAVPAPLPGYALLLFVPLGVLSYVAASAIWLVVLVATSALSAVALAMLVRRPVIAAVCVLAVGFAITLIPFGELGSIVMAALLWMAVALRRGAWTYAAIIAAFTMILPHLGLPALAGVFLFVPAMRVRVAVLALGLVLLDVLAGGTHIAFEYIATVLPAHARAEIGSTVQYGVTWMLHALGASDSASIGVGSLSYAVMVVLGLIAGWKLFTVTRDPAYVAVVPPAFAVLGGTFVHYTQIMIAIPAALLLYFHTRGGARGAFAVATLLLAIPWLWALGQPALVVVYAIACAAIVQLMFEWDGSSALRVAFGAVLVTGAILFAGFHFGSGLSAQAHALAAHQGLAQSAWGAYIRGQRSSIGPAWWIAKAPTWLGLVLLALGCAYVLTKKDFVAPVAVEQMPVTT